MCQVLEINDPRELVGFRLLWNCLLRQTPGASFFHTLDWLQILWSRCGQNQRLRVLVAVAGKRAIGIMPLCTRTERQRLGRVRLLTYPRHDRTTRCGPIGPNPAATLLAAMRHVRETPRDWDVLELGWVDACGRDRGRTPRAMRAVGFGCTTQPAAVTPVFRLHGTWDQYVAKQSDEWRAQRRREQQRLAARGAVTYVRYRPQGASRGDGDPRWDLWGACQQIVRRRRQTRPDETASRQHPSPPPLFDEAHAAAARLGMLDVNVLRVDGRPVAFAYNYQLDGNLIGLQTGCDQRLAAAGCGDALQARMIRDSFARGDQQYEFGPGSLDFESRYCTHTETSYRCTHFAAGSSRAAVLRLQRWVAGLV